ncbi:hypothetical protein GW816_02410 [Candidatus Wolfebacteria bacterium]|nr:hypothetical protein [Candidatus Wolfebacteria bacterium]
MLYFVIPPLWLGDKIGTFFNHNRRVVKFAINKVTQAETKGTYNKN